MPRRAVFPVVMAFLLAALGIFFFQRRTAPAGSFSFAALNPLRLFQSPPEEGTPALVQTYANSDYGFSFSYPQGFTVSAFPEGEGDTVLVQRIVGAGAKAEPPKVGGRTSESLGFQIYVSPFDEPGPITPERIRKDIPDMIIESPKNVILGAPGHLEPSEGSRDSSAALQNDGGVPALAFLSGDPPRRTREIWFVRGLNLYQITAYAKMDEALGEILKTWEFQ